MRPALALIALLVLLAGCAKEGLPENAANETAAQSFGVPYTAHSYRASYRIGSDGGEISKTVWRKASSLRVDYVFSDSTPQLALYFLGNRSYSCADAGGGTKCFETTGKAGQEALAALLVQPDLAGSRGAEIAKIGSVEGTCHLLPEGQSSERKVCYTPDGILAYDERASGRGGRQVEYLVELSYDVSDSDFALPENPLPQG